MSGIYLTVEESLKLNMMRYLNCTAVESITLTNPRPQGDLGLPNSDWLIDVMYNGELRTVGYKRYTLNNIFGAYDTKKIPINLGALELTLSNLLDVMRSTLGFDIPYDYVDLEKSVVKTDGDSIVVIKSECPYMTGSLSVTVTDNISAGKYPTPKHEWMLEYNTVDTGTANIPMTAPFKFVSKAGGMWGTLKGGRTPQAFGNNIKLMETRNWTFDFEIMFATIKTYDNIFVENVPGGYINGQFTFYQGKFFESYITTATHGKAVPVNTPTRHTMVCVNGVVSYYYEGVKVETWTTSTSRKFITGFRNNLTAASEGQCEEDNCFFRRLRFWDKPLTDPELELLFKTRPVDAKYPMPKHEWALTDSLVASGTAGLPLTAPFKFVERDTGKWATLTGGKTSYAFGPGITFDKTSNNWCLDFELLVTSRVIRNVIFANAVGQGMAPGWVLFYENRLYELYGNSDLVHEQEMQRNTPTRHTLRCVNGKIRYYMDGGFVQEWSTATVQSPLAAFRGGDNSATFPGNFDEDVTFMRNLRFWDAAMSDTEFDEMLGATGPVYKPPVHHWKLNGEITNIGTGDKTPWGPPVKFTTDSSGGLAASLTTVGNHPLNLSFDASKDWSISMFATVPDLGHKGLFTTQSSLTYGVSSMFYMSKLTTYLGTTFANNWYTANTNILMKANKRHHVVMTKRGNFYCMYVDGVIVQRVEATAAVTGAFTHFGVYNGSNPLDITTKFSDVRFYDYALPLKHIVEISKGAR